MATADKGKNLSQKVKGKIKEVTGKTTGDDKLARKGKADQTKGSLKQTGEKLKDTFKRR